MLFGLRAEPAGATTLPTTISSDMTLTAAGSPYTGAAVTIASGVTVTAEPGAVIKLTGALYVDGTLDAQGTSTNEVVFTSGSDSGSGQWGGLRLNTSGSVIDHAQVRYGDTGVMTDDLQLDHPQ